jgi:hypothetical protein
MFRKLALVATTLTLGSTAPALAQNVSVLLGGRVTESDTSAAYLSVTNNFAPLGTDGVVLRGELEHTRTDFAGTESKQNLQRVLLGYAFNTQAGTFTGLIGPTHVTRSINGGPDVISETGIHVGAEGYGFYGEGGYWAGLAQYSSPDEAFYTRGFTTYLVGGNTNIGPDLSYLDEPNFERGTLGLRTAWTFDQTVVALIGGASQETGTAGGDETEGFLELQVGLSF